MKIIYEVIFEEDIAYKPIIDGVQVYILPKCPNCEKLPTYNMNPCPYCGVDLEYPEGVEVEE